MSFKTLMITKAFVSLGFGILMLAIPALLLSIFGAALGDAGMFTAREYGAALLGNTCLCWIGKNLTDPSTTKAIIVALFVYDLVGVIVTLFTVVYGILNPLGWFVVVIYLYFTIGFGYFLINPISQRND